MKVLTEEGVELDTEEYQRQVEEHEAQRRKLRDERLAREAMMALVALEQEEQEEKEEAARRAAAALLAPPGDEDEEGEGRGRLERRGGFNAPPTHTHKVQDPG